MDQGGTQSHKEKGPAPGYIWEEELLGLADQRAVRHLVDIRVARWCWLCSLEFQDRTGAAGPGQRSLPPRHVLP